MYDKIQFEYNYFISSKNNVIDSTEFKRKFANTIGTTLSNIYEIIKSGLIEVYDYSLNKRIEFFAQVAWNKRTKKSVESIFFKRESSKDFINLLIKEFRSDYNINSIGEIINDFKINRQDEIKGLITICTSTFYNYVEDDKIDGFSKKRIINENKKEKEKSKETKKNFS